MLVNKSLEEFLEELATGKPTPGGGSVAALAGSLAAALVEMVCCLTDTNRMRGLAEEAKNLRYRLLKLVQEDSEAFRRFVKSPKNEKEEALKNAALVPLETAELSYRVLEIADEAARNGKRSAITDAGVASLLADAAVHGAELNVKINLNAISDRDFAAGVEARLKRIGDYPRKTQQTMNYISGEL